MPARKRKRDDTCPPLNTSHVGFLSLPLEIKYMVYEHCFLPTTERERKASSKPTTRKSPKVLKMVTRRSKKDNFFEKSRCNYPMLHQSLLLTCRQIYTDVWPLYTACHSIVFSHPIRFANDFLSYKPLHQLQHVKHLSLRAVDNSTIYNTASKHSMRGMVSDLKRTFEHYPDVFHNLLSFTWETRDTRNYCSNRIENQHMMCEFLLTKLVEIHKHEREQAGLPEIQHDGHHAQLSMMHSNLNRWRTGCVARSRNLTVDNFQKYREQSTLIFFERLQPSGEIKPGLEYIDIARWLHEPLTFSTVMFGQCQQLVQPLPPVWYPPDAPHSKLVHWTFGQLDHKRGTDWLRHAVIIDVGT